VGQAFAQVKTYITHKGSNLTDVPGLITVLETGFGNLNHIATAGRKLEVTMQTNYNCST
jgi:hypothetical protein